MRTITLLLFVALVATAYAVKVKELSDILMFALSDSTGAQCATTALNLRSQPSTNGGYIRTIPKGASVNVHSVNNGWAQVDGGYVSAQYLSDCGAVTKCTTTALNLRNSPSTSGGFIRTLPAGAQVKVYSTSNGWSQVDGGYVSAEYLTNCGSSGPVTKCATTALNLRSQPSTNGGFIRTIPAGGQVKVHSTNNGWAQVDGGYVSAQYLSDCGGGSGGGYNCGQAYDNGRAIGDKHCVKIDGEAVVTTTADVFNRMKSAAASNGVHLRVNSGFRTMKDQEYFWNCYQTKRCNNGNLAARPGYSNHQNGIALDINSPSDVYNWLARHASSYGFIRTVPSEVWHWEYRPGSRCNSWVSYSCN